MTKDDYKAEGLRRMKLRKQKRNHEYKLRIERAQELGVPLYGTKPGGYWEDSFHQQVIHKFVHMKYMVLVNTLVMEIVKPCEIA